MAAAAVAEHTPHVSKLANAVDASLSGATEGLARLQHLRPLLRRMARDPSIHRPGLVGECAMDSIGALLTEHGSAHAEPHRCALMTGTPPEDLRVWLARPKFRAVGVAEARRLPAAQLETAVPLRNADEVALPLAPDAQQRMEVRVAYAASGAGLTVRRRGPLGLEVAVTAGTAYGAATTVLASEVLPTRPPPPPEPPAPAAPPAPPVASAAPTCEEDESLAIEQELQELEVQAQEEYDELDELFLQAHDAEDDDGLPEVDGEHVVRAELAALFAPQPATLGSALPPARRPFFLAKAKTPSFQLPDWLAESLATAFDEVGRVGAVLAAAQPPGQRTLLCVDRGTLVQHHDRQRDKDLRTVVRLPLHAISGRCICQAYDPAARKFPGASGAPQSVLLEMQCCGLPFSRTGRPQCAQHAARPEPPSDYEGTCCTADLALRLVCQHVHARPVSIPIEIPADCAREVKGIAAVAMASCADRELPFHRAAELRGVAQRIEERLYATLFARAAWPIARLDHADKVAAGLLRSHAVRRGKPRKRPNHDVPHRPLVKPAGGQLRREEAALFETHGHLFLPVK